MTNENHASGYAYPRLVGKYPRVTAETNFNSNYVSTTKYTPLTFLPFSIMVQFKRLANVYFFLIAILQSIPAISPLTPVTAIAPLVFVVLLSVARDGIEDYNRYKSDKTVNERLVDVYVSETKSFVRKAWQEITVGDIVRVHDRESIPADLLLLSSVHEDGTCHLDTMNLDGETNLKRRSPQSTTVIFHDLAVEELITIHQQLMLECEEPIESLYQFNGNIHLGDDVVVPVDDSQLLLRGSTLRNTSWVLGLVSYTGDDTKEMLGSKNGRHKHSNIETQVNRLIISVFSTQMVMAIVAGVFGGMWVTNDGEDHFYLACDDYYDCKGSTVGILEFLTYIVLLNTLIPISLVVTMEFVKVFQALLIQQDLDMIYYVEEVVSDIDSNTTSGDVESSISKSKVKYVTVPKPPSVRSVTLNEELGQIHHIFSDKTGTLTENKMEFSVCSVAGSVFSSDQQFLGNLDPSKSGLGYVGEMMDLGKRASQNPGGAEEMFLTSLLICNTIILEKNPDGSISYNADSPDEVALVKGAALAGYRLMERNGELVDVDLNGVLVTYEILHIIPFSSARKRMSVIARRVARDMEMNEGVSYDIVVFTKGADNVITERCSSKWLTMPHNHLGVRMQQFYNFCRRKAGGGGKRQDIQEDTKEEGDETGKNDLWSVFSNMVGSEDENKEDEYKVDLTPPPSHFLSPEIEVMINNDIITSPPASKMIEVTSNQLSEFATLGLRTLCFGYRVLSPAHFSRWAKDVSRAELLTPQERNDTFTELSKEIERELTLIASTAIEDKLQDDVPVTLQRLLRAEIKVWVLTGDKLETAIEIARSCGLVTATTNVHIIASLEDESATATKLGSVLSEARKNIEESHTIVVDGLALSHIIRVDRSTGEVIRQSNSDTFMSITDLCTTVVVCRCSPSQKAQVVELVRLYTPHIITLAVGDGANDVAMIRAANVGVGIAGQEGMQAVRSSDYAVQKFRDLDPLLLYHGRLAYSRLSKMITYFFFKNFAFTVPLWVFGAYCAWSGQAFYDDIYITMYNTLFTFLPAFAYGLLEQEVAKDTAFHLPEIYRVSQWNYYFRKSVIAYWFVVGFILSASFIIIPIYSQPYNTENPDGLWTLSVASFSCVIIPATVQIMLNTSHWDIYTTLAYLISIVLYFGLVYAYDEVPGAKVEGVLPKVFHSYSFWLVLVLITAIVCIVHLAIVWINRLFAPENWIFSNQVHSFLPPPITPVEVVQRLSEEEAVKISNKVQMDRFGSVSQRVGLQEEGGEPRGPRLTSNPMGDEEVEEEKSNQSSFEVEGL